MTDAGTVKPEGLRENKRLNRDLWSGQEGHQNRLAMPSSLRPVTIAKTVAGHASPSDDSPTTQTITPFHQTHPYQARYKPNRYRVTLEFTQGIARCPVIRRNSTSHDRLGEA